VLKYLKAICRERNLILFKTKHLSGLFY